MLMLVKYGSNPSTSTALPSSLRMTMCRDRPIQVYSIHRVFPSRAIRLWNLEGSATEIVVSNGCSTASPEEREFSIKVNGSRLLPLQTTPPCHPERKRRKPLESGSRVLQIRLRNARLLWNSLHKTCNEIKDFG